METKEINVTGDLIAGGTVHLVLVVVADVGIVNVLQVVGIADISVTIALMEVLPHQFQRLGEGTINIVITKN
jgi:hypothetical protein